MSPILLTIQFNLSMLVHHCINVKCYYCFVFIVLLDSPAHHAQCRNLQIAAQGAL